MVHKENFVVAIKHNGRVLREDGEHVTLPFGSEYEIRLKNLDSRKAVVSVDIDGEDVLEGSRIIVDGNSSMDLEGFMDGMSARRRFKFIKKIKEISRYRGDREDDGCIRVEVWFEQRQPIVWSNTLISKRSPYDYYNNYKLWDCTSYSNSLSSFTCNTGNDTNNCSNQILEKEAGITVEGSDCDQDFYYGSTNTLESNSTVLTLWLRGTEDRIPIKSPIYVRSKKKCNVCGKTSNSRNKFCPICGARL